MDGAERDAQLNMTSTAPKAPRVEDSSHAIDDAAMGNDVEPLTDEHGTVGIPAT